MTKRAIAGLATTITVLGGGVTAVAVALMASGDTPALVEAEGQNLLSNETLEDWVTYGDHVVVVKLVSSKDLEASDEDVEVGEGFVPRVTSYEITDVLWSREGARPAPAELSINLDGYALQDGKQVPMKLKGEPMLDDVGNAYVMPIFYLEKTASVGIAGWSNLSPDSILPFNDDVVGQGDKIVGKDARTKAASTVWGQSRKELTSTLAGQPADPAAGPFMAEPPDVRYNHVYAATHDLDKSDVAE